MKKAVAGLVVFLCSDRGQEIANQYLASEKERRAAAEQEVLALLQKRKFKEASLLVASYEAKCVFSRGIGIDWQNYDPSREVVVLKAVFGGRPKALARLDQSKLEPLRLAAGMMLLWGTNTAQSRLPTGLETGLAVDSNAAARMLSSYGIYRANLEEYGKSRYRFVTISTCNDGFVCEACRNLAGKHKLSEVPELPYEKCTSDMGCRCWMCALIGVLDTR
jgi:hypothetical protein